MTGKEDAIIPAEGGPSVIPDKSTAGKLAFLSWQESAFAWAQAYGFAGAPIAAVVSPVHTKVEYLDGLG